MVDTTFDKRERHEYCKSTTG